MSKPEFADAARDASEIASECIKILQAKPQVTQGMALLGLIEAWLMSLTPGMRDRMLATVKQRLDELEATLNVGKNEKPN